MKKAQGDIKYYVWKGVKIFFFSLIFVFLSGIIWDLYYSFFSGVDVSPQSVERNYLEVWINKEDQRLLSIIDNDSVYVEESRLYIGDSMIVIRDTLGNDNASIPFDSLYQLEDTLRPSQPVVLLKNELNIQGITRPGLEVELHINKRRKKRVYTDNSGSFETYLSDLPRGQSELLFSSQKIRAIITCEAAKNE